VIDALDKTLIPNAQNGTRILVERLWPRGLSKAKAHHGAVREPR
jgi:uncharacterized protein YeaO (DUF488 family)